MHHKALSELAQWGANVHMHACAHGRSTHVHKNTPWHPLHQPYMAKRHNLSTDGDKRLIGFSKRLYPEAQQTTTASVSARECL